MSVHVGEQNGQLAAGRVNRAAPAPPPPRAAKAGFYADRGRRPDVLRPDLDAVPPELRDTPHWMLWRLVWKGGKDGGGKWDKPPVRPDGRPAKTNDPGTWAAFAEIAAAYRGGGFDGTGFALGGGFVGIDLDDVRDPATGDLTTEAAALVRRFATYAEVSPSGTGVKLFGRGVWPAGWNRKPFPGGGGIEVYSAGRYFTVTGRAVGPYPVADVAPALAELAGRFSDTRAAANDDELIRKAGAARNGGKFRRLWAGDTSEHGGDESRADLALCGLLAFWCGGDADRIDRLFRRSGLMRPKWDERRVQSTYGRRTVAEALAGRTEFYTPGGGTTSAHANVNPAGGSRKSEVKPQPARVLISRTAADVTAAAVQWLWPDRIPLGMVSEWIGDPGLGKSCAAVSLAAAVTTGRPLPLHPRHRVGPAAVVLLSGEESWECVIKPRLVAAGADPGLVHTVEGVRVGDDERPLALPQDLDLVEAKMVETGARLLVIDPLNDHIAAGIDTHKEADVRTVTRRLKQLAEKTGAAVLILRHPNKGVGGPAIYRGGGSLGVTAAARVSLMAGKHPHRGGLFVLSGNKSNVGVLPRAVTYSIDVTGGQPVVVWGDECDLTADDITAPPDRENGEKLNEAAEFLRAELAEGGRPQKDIEGKAKAEGIKGATLHRAKKQLGVRPRKDGFGGSWLWELPSAGPADEEPAGGHPGG